MGGINSVARPETEGQEKYFEWHDIEAAVVWARRGGIAIHRNFDVDGIKIGIKVRSGPALHVFGLHGVLLRWARRNRLQPAWLQEAEGMFPPHFDVFGRLAVQLVKRQEQEQLQLG